MSQNPQGQAGQQMHPPGPPYPPQVWMLGGKPKASVDVPITAVFLFLFTTSAGIHMAIFQINRKMGHKFLMSGLLFGFSMSRIVTTIMRIASVLLPTDVPLAIAANIFVAAGVVLLYVINLIFTQRILRASHPHFGWHKLAGLAFKALYVVIVLTIAMIITVTVQSFYTLNPNIRRIDRDVQLTGSTIFAVIAFLPIPLVLVGLLIPRRHKLDKFGHGRWRTKIAILLLATVLVTFGASYRCGTSWMTPVPLTRPIPAYFHKGAFYVVNFTMEVLVLYLYAFLRVDKRFHVPDGARGYGSYSGMHNQERSKTTSATPIDEKRISAMDSDFSHGVSAVEPALEPKSSILPKFNSEEEVFDTDEWAESRKKEDLEAAQSPADSSWNQDAQLAKPPQTVHPLGDESLSKEHN